MNVSLAGSNTFQTGDHLGQYCLSNTGASVLGSVYGSDSTVEWHGALQNVINVGSTNLQRTAYAGAMSNAIATGEGLNSSLTGVTLPLPDLFKATSLGNQLKMVARMICASQTMGVKRQTFFTQAGGYDTHADQVAIGSPGTGTHANLLLELSDAIFAFQRNMEALGYGDKVVSFTASDFGRTYVPNGLGSDHGWGGHHFVIGGTGAVNGGPYGTLPTTSMIGVQPLDFGEGRWIPKISVDEYSATLAKWFGVTNDNLNTVFPNLRYFVNRDLGFMKA